MTENITLYTFKEPKLLFQFPTQNITIINDFPPMSETSDESDTEEEQSMPENPPNIDGLILQPIVLQEQNDQKIYDTEYITLISDNINTIALITDDNNEYSKRYTKQTQPINITVDEEKIAIILCFNVQNNSCIDIYHLTEFTDINQIFNQYPQNSHLFLLNETSSINFKNIENKLLGNLTLKDNNNLRLTNISSFVTKNVAVYLYKKEEDITFGLTQFNPIELHKYYGRSIEEYDDKYTESSFSHFYSIKKAIDGNINISNASHIIMYTDYEILWTNAGILSDTFFHDDDYYGIHQDGTIVQLTPIIYAKEYPLNTNYTPQVNYFIRTDGENTYHTNWPQQNTMLHTEIATWIKNYTPHLNINNLNIYNTISTQPKVKVIMFPLGGCVRSMYTNYWFPHDQWNDNFNTNARKQKKYFEPFNITAMCNWNWANWYNNDTDITNIKFTQATEKTNLQGWTVKYNILNENPKIYEFTISNIAYEGEYYGNIFSTNQPNSLCCYNNFNNCLAIDHETDLNNNFRKPQIPLSSAVFYFGYDLKEIFRSYCIEQNPPEIIIDPPTEEEELQTQIKTITYEDEYIKIQATFDPQYENIIRGFKYGNVQCLHETDFNSTTESSRHTLVNNGLVQRLLLLRSLDNVAIIYLPQYTGTRTSVRYYGKYTSYITEYLKTTYNFQASIIESYYINTSIVQTHIQSIDDNPNSYLHIWIKQPSKTISIKEGFKFITNNLHVYVPNSDLAQIDNICASIIPFDENTIYETSTVEENPLTYMNIAYYNTTNNSITIRDYDGTQSQFIYLKKQPGEFIKVSTNNCKYAIIDPTRTYKYTTVTAMAIHERSEDPTPILKFESHELTNCFNKPIPTSPTNYISYMKNNTNVPTTNYLTGVQNAHVTTEQTGQVIITLNSYEQHLSLWVSSNIHTSVSSLDDIPSNTYFWRWQDYRTYTTWTQLYIYNTPVTPERCTHKWAIRGNYGSSNYYPLLESTQLNKNVIYVTFYNDILPSAELPERTPFIRTWLTNDTGSDITINRSQEILLIKSNNMHFTFPNYYYYYTSNTVKPGDKYIRITYEQKEYSNNNSPIFHCNDGTAFAFYNGILVLNPDGNEF